MSTAPRAATMQQALAAFQRGDFVAAFEAARAVLASAPEDFDALHLGGVAAARSGRIDDAVRMLEAAVRVGGGQAEAAMHLGVVLLEAGRPAEALLALDRAIGLAPAHPLAHYNRASALQKLARLDDARRAYDRALALHPGFVPALRNRADLALAQGEPAPALADYDRVLAQGTVDTGLLVNRGVALERLARSTEALESFDAALRAAPHDADANFGRGNTLRTLRRLDDALAAYDRAVELRPDFAAAWHNRATALGELQRNDAAIASFDRALALDPAYADAWTGRGNALRAADRDDDALASYARALALAPGADFLEGTWLHAKMTVCDWRGIDADFRALEARIAKGERASPPFPTLAMPFSAQVQQAAARTWATVRHPSRGAAASGDRPAASNETATAPGRAASRAAGPRDPRQRIRIGYFAATLHEHATAYLMAELFERHDRARFEVSAFSFGPDTGDAMRGRLVQAFEHFHDVRQRSDDDIAAFARERGIDIAVDLMGYTREGRPDIFAARAAPLQVSWLGYPGTLGAPYVDYVIADHHVLAAGDEAHYDERIVRLPGSYQVNDAHRPRAGVAPPRESLGLPRDAFVFCCFNNSYKILPATFDAWMRILRAVEGSVLWLLEDNATAADNLRREAAQRDIDPARLVFAPRVPLAQHLARHGTADLVLDTLPYNAHTTASDALWTGVPVLTLAGDTFAGRVASSLLAAVGLPELVTRSCADYEGLAVSLARDAPRLAAIRARLERGRASAPLFDAAAFARHLEAAFDAMVARLHAGLLPVAFDVGPSASRAGQ